MTQLGPSLRPRRVSPSQADQHQRDGLKSAGAGRYEEAIVHFEKAAALRPGNSVVQFNLGLTFQQLKQIHQAISAYQAALRVSPDFFAAWMNLAAAFLSAGRWSDAIVAARSAIDLDPYHPNAYRLLANALNGAQNRVTAQQALRRAIEIEADPFFKNLENSVKSRKQGRLNEAWRFSQAAMQIHPHHPLALFNQGLHRLAQNQIQDALVCLYQAAEFTPQRAEIWTEIGHALMSLNALKEAPKAYRQALECNPNWSAAHYGLAQAQLANGNLEQAWPEFEARWSAGGPRYCKVPVWSGEELKGQRILLYCEQGLGDMIQFVRYAPLVADRGGSVLIECPGALVRILQTVAGVQSVFALGDPPPDFDVQASVFALPRLFQTTLQNIPGQAAYVSVPPACAVALPELPPAWLKVGLVWAGSGGLEWGLSRSIPLTELKSIWSMPDVAFYSLQVKAAVKHLNEVPGADRICDLSAQLTNLAATASAIQQLDLVITVDTSVAHLAGALGKPVWVLLPFATGWRWMIDRSNSPWYPSMRLFRQRERGDWRGIVREMRKEFTALKKRSAPVVT